MQTFKYWRKNFRRLESQVTEDANFSAVKNLHKHFIIFNVNATQKSLIPLLSGWQDFALLIFFKYLTFFAFNSLELLEIILFYYMRRTSKFLHRVCVLIF